ncbi:hypothetical protein MASR2M70_07600 [Bacillota bacterium]
MESYTALRRSSLKKDYTKFTVACGILIMIIAFFMKDYTFVAVGAVVIYVALYSKDVVIDEKGMTTHYHAIIYNKSKTYPFSEFSELRVIRSLPSETVIGFIRKGMNTNCIFTAEDAENVIDLALEHNPRIHITQMEGRKRRQNRNSY